MAKKGAAVDIGVIGMAVMGQNLVLNFLDHSYNVAIFNRTKSKVDHFMEKWSTMIESAQPGTPTPSSSLEEFVSTMEGGHRKIILMIQAGDAIDALLSELVPLLSPEDIVIDGGNSHYVDTQRRAASLSSSHKIRYVGCGISGGELGARYGPALMPGGSLCAWEEIKDMLQKIAAKGPKGYPCCEWLGPDASGHFVKMVHNGIEYADMQMISEIFHVAKNALAKDTPTIACLFQKWASSEYLSSYLIEITANILFFKESENDTSPLISRIRDTAGQKGTGKWTVEAALTLGVPGTLFSEAVFARSLSSSKKERLNASLLFPKKEPPFDTPFGDISHILGEALLAAKIIAYCQGFSLLMKASKNHGWSLSGSTISKIWQGGCIIRSKLLVFFEDLDDLQFENLLVSKWASERLKASIESLRTIVGLCVSTGVPSPVLSSALSYFDTATCSYLPGAALIQAQRDYFGAHQYELEATPGLFHHTNWTGSGGSALSSTYQYPSSARNPVDWDAITTSSDEESSGAKQEKGEDQLKNLFQKIYDQGTDDTRRAMIKSLQESGGTCLSTNWKDVGSAPVKPSPPEGCEARKFD